MTVSAAGAEKVKAEVQKVKDKAQKIVDEINVEKAYATEKLDAAKPALELAESALKVSNFLYNRAFAICYNRAFAICLVCFSISQHSGEHLT